MEMVFITLLVEIFCHQNVKLSSISLPLLLLDLLVRIAMMSVVSLTRES